MSATEIELLSLTNWLKTNCQLANFELVPLVNDASFRRYYRVQLSQYSYIVMLAPPHKENITAFIAIAKNFAQGGVHVPEILSYDLKQGYILLSDLGNDLYLKLLNTENADELYTRALNIIPLIQICKPRLSSNQALGFFNEKIIRFELNLFVEWFLQQHLKPAISIKQKKALEQTFQHLISAILEQPRVCIHRDYHSRNLLLIDKHKVGVLDFQDALYGPIAYDAVSLLRDAYKDWPDSLVSKWALNFYHMLTLKNRFSAIEFLRWFDWLGIQRHLKILGIFARLCYRDHKPAYLCNTNRLLNYLKQTCDKYIELKELKLLLQFIPSDRVNNNKP